MKKYLVLLTMIPLFLCAAELKAPLKLDVDKDDRNWKVIRDDDINGQGIVEMVLPGEDQNNWKELVTVQYFWSDTLDPQELFQLFMRELQQQAGAGKVTSSILEEKKGDVMAEWQVEGTANDQKELVRIFGDGEVVVVIRYTMKLGSDSQKNSDTWREIIKNASIKTKE